MKRTILLYILIGFFAMTMKAQVFNPSVKMSESLSATDPGMLATIVFDANFVVNDHFSVGPGTGLGYAIFFEEKYRLRLLDKYESAFTIPLYLQAKYFLIPNRKVSPYLHARAGYSFCIQGNFDHWLDWIDNHHSNDIINGTGFDMSFGPGIDIALNCGSLQVSFDWNMLKTKYCSRDHYTSETMFGISVGYSWGRRR